MDALKLVEGKRVRYTARVHSGTAKVVSVYKRKTGTWVLLHDKSRNAAVTVRASQVSSL